MGQIELNNSKVRFGENGFPANTGSPDRTGAGSGPQKYWGRQRLCRSRAEAICQKQRDNVESLASPAATAVPFGEAARSPFRWALTCKKRILKMAKLSAFTKNNLNKQGFETLDDEAISCYALPLRFSPGVGTILIVFGLALQSPIWLGSLALVALSGALFPKGMLIDLVYNLGVRHLFHAPPLPPTPKPRRFSYILSTTLLAGSALSFYFGLSWLGFILGAMVVIGGTILSTSLWCLGSWYYRLIFGHARVKKDSGKV